MKDSERKIFINLFGEAYKKCFDATLSSPLSESDCRILSNDILEKTGLVIGQKSLRNYSLYILDESRQRSGKENPGIATLDTLSRYVLNAPYTDEIKRKQNESHHPYWHRYKKKYATKCTILSNNSSIHLKLVVSSVFSVFIIVLIILIMKLYSRNNRSIEFIDEFNSSDEDTLKKNGWIFRGYDPFWTKRDTVPGHISLFTLNGDNWPNGDKPAMIRNLLMRRINADCYFVEAHLSNFFPHFNWQQAGIILSEDSTLKSKMLRISISYNDYFGGYSKSPELIIQILSSSQTGNLSKPEEIAHIPLFTIEPGNEDLIGKNLVSSALKIEKMGKHFRFLYLFSNSSDESFAFYEAASGDFDIEPKYVSLFAIQGWTNKNNYIPASFDSFRLMEISCQRTNN
jgi:hypothetical protein